MSEATLVFTDIVDSTRLVEQLGDAAAAELWARHDRRVRDLLRHHNGREVDRTDGFFAIFERAPDAAAFAAACHHAVAEFGLRARVALHTGAVTLRENAPADVARGAKPVEVEGLAKPFAARLNGLAAPGQTLASAAASVALGGWGALCSHGHYRLKGLAEPVEVFELGHGAEPAFAPPGDTDKAYRVMRAADGIAGIWQPVREVPHNLPAERDAFIGRAAEMHALAARLDSGERLVTVLGAGGIGKTRFVRRYARIWLGDWPGGVHFCDLSDARSPDGVLGAVAVGLGIPLGSDDAVRQLGHAIAARGPCLVILDNVEQVLTPVAEALSRWLDRAGGARFVVTSRERLRLDGEGVLSLEALPLDGEADGAVALFMARARLQLPGFAADPAQHAAVAKIVQLLDGMPLAIELAAARVRLLSPAQIVERLRDRFALLAGTRGTAARQATLRGAIDWSWELLGPIEQAAFAQCAVFEGGFTLAAAEAVLDLGRDTAAATIDIVQALLDKSLLRVSHPRGQADEAEPRFGMFASLHEYARERLGESGETAAAEARHGHHFAALGSAGALDALHRSDGPRRRRALAIELDNLVIACRRALARGDAPIAASSYAAAWAVLERQGPRALGVALGEELAAATMPPGPRIVVLRTYGSAAHRAGDPARGAAAALEALALARSTGDRRAEADVLAELGDIRFDEMRLDDARIHLEAALVASRAAGDRIVEARTLCRLAALAHLQGQWDDLATLTTAALELLRATGSRHQEPALLTMRAMREHGFGHSQAALDMHRRVGEIAREAGNRSAEAVSLINLGGVLLDLGRDEEALPALQAALAIQREIGGRANEGMVLGNIGILHQQQGRADDAREHFESALAISREVGDRRHELYLLGSLGELHLEQRDFDAAAACYAAALDRRRGADDPFNAGRLLAGRGKLHWLQHRLDDAEQVLADGEALLRGRGDQIELLKLLCTRGQVELGRGRRDSALRMLAEAEAGAASMGASSASVLAREIDALRSAIG